MKQGFTLVGWLKQDTNTNGTIYYVGETFTHYTDTTLYAVWTANADNDGSVQRLVPPLAGGITKIFERIGSGVASFVESNPFGAVLSMLSVLVVGILSIRVWFDLRKDKFLRTQERNFVNKVYKNCTNSLLYNNKLLYNSKQMTNDNKAINTTASNQLHHSSASSGSFVMASSHTPQTTNIRKPRFTKKQKTIAGLALATIALLLVFVSIFNSNWQLSFGLKSASDIHDYGVVLQQEWQSDKDERDRQDKEDKYGIDNDESESGISDEEAFLYSRVFTDLLSLGYYTFTAFAIKDDGAIVKGLGYTDYRDVYDDGETGDKYFGAGFVASLNEPSISQDDVEDGIKIVQAYDETENSYEKDELQQLILTFSEEYGSIHYIAFEQYVRYEVKDFSIQFTTQADDRSLQSTWGEELGYLYDFDLGRPVYDPDLGKEFNPNGYSLSNQVDYALINDAYRSFIYEQTSNGIRVDDVSMAYISMEALNDFMANNQEESFLGISPEEIYYIQANLPDTCFYYVDENGEPQILELPPDPPAKATLWERIITAVAVIAVVAVAIVVVVATCGVAAPFLIGAAVGFGVEIIMQVVVGGIPPKDIDWRKVAVSTVAGALSAIPGMSWWGAGLIMGGSQAAVAWLDGADFKDILLAFGIGFATGVVIHFATKALSKLSSKISDKLGKCFIAGTQVLALNANNDIITKNIEDIRKGDKVVSYDETTGIIESKTVTQTFESNHDELIKVTTSDDQTITSSVGHPYYVQNKSTWIEAQNLRAGDILRTVNGKKVVVEQVQHEILERTETLYNFEVEDNHDYFVGENTNITIEQFVLVHNFCEPGAYRIKVDLGDEIGEYIGKGPESRMWQSVARLQNDKFKIIGQEWFKTSAGETAFELEARMMNESAKESIKLINKIASPGHKLSGANKETLDKLKKVLFDSWSHLLQ